MNYLETREAILAQIGDKWTSGFDISVDGVPLTRILIHLDTLVFAGAIWRRTYVRSIDAAEVEYRVARDVGDPSIGSRPRMATSWVGEIA